MMPDPHGPRGSSHGSVVALDSGVPLLAVTAVTVVTIGIGPGATTMYASLEMQHPMWRLAPHRFLLRHGVRRQDPAAALNGCSPSVTVKSAVSCSAWVHASSASPTGAAAGWL